MIDFDKFFKIAEEQLEISKKILDLTISMEKTLRELRVRLLEKLGSLSL